MNNTLLFEVISLFDDFEKNHTNKYSDDIQGFQKWLLAKNSVSAGDSNDLEWEGKSNGRSSESMIATFLVHLNRYAKAYSKAAMHDSQFSTQDEFVYLIQLKAIGEMTKTELIRRNVQEKNVGIQIVNRLIQHGWVLQRDSESDKRSKLISITELGLEELENHMDKIRLATQIVSGNLSEHEKMELIRLLSKLDHFHQTIFQSPVANHELLPFVSEKFLNQ